MDAEIGPAKGQGADKPSHPEEGRQDRPKWEQTEIWTETGGHIEGQGRRGDREVGRQRIETLVERDRERTWRQPNQRGTGNDGGQREVPADSGQRRGVTGRLW